MRLNSADRGDLRRFRDARDEEVAAHTVVAALSGEGRAVTRFDRVPQGTGRSPDFLITVDDHRVALEIVRYLSPAEHQAAMARVILVEEAVRERLVDDARRHGKTIAVDIRHSIEGLSRHRRKDVQADADVLASDIRKALDGPVGPLGHHPVAASVVWVDEAHVGLVESHEPSAYFIKAATDPDPDEFVRQTMEAKADQHLGYADTAILAITATFDDHSEDLAPALVRHRVALPWWRVYFARYDAKLLIEQGSGPGG